MYKLLIGFVLVFTLSQVCSSNEEKPTKHANGSGSEAVSFRSKKAKLIWIKGSQELKHFPEKLERFTRKLKRIDEDLMKLKKMKLDGLDILGERENQINDEIDALLEETGIKKFFPSEFHHSEPGTVNTDKLQTSLDSIYEKAKKLGFSADELTDLETEISHHRRKVAELAVLKEQLEENHKRKMELSNAVEIDREEQRAHAERMKKISMDLKDIQSELHGSLEKLDASLDMPGKTLSSSFSNEKVLQLWAAVLKANFTKEEQLSLKQELLHLEQKIMKKEHLDHDLDLLAKSGTEIIPGREDLHKKEEHMKQRREEVSKHVDKYTSQLERKIEAKREEL